MTTERPEVSKHSLHPVAVALQITIIALLAVLVWRQLAPGIALESESGYFGLVLANGQTYYARIEQQDSEVMLLADVYYIKQTINPKTGKKSNQLTNRRKQAHGPEHMYVRTQQVVSLEPVTSESEMGRVIKQLKSAAEG